MKLYHRKEIATDLDGVTFNFYVDVDMSNVSARTLLLSSLPLHTHIYTEMFVCAKGSIVIDSADKKYKLTAGDAVFLPAGFAHTRLQESVDDSEWLSIGITLLPSDPSHNPYENLCYFLKGTEPRLFNNCPQLFERAKNLVDAAILGTPLLPKLEFLTELVKLASQIDNENADFVSEKSQPLFDAMLNFEHILHHRYSQQLSVKDIAKELCMGERQLYRAVKKHFGLPIHTLILQRRISIAQKLLTETAQPVEKIAIDVGFSNKVAFHRSFKQLTGTTPANFRKRQFQKNNTPEN